MLAERDPRALAALAAFRDVELPEQLLVRDIMTERPRYIAADVPARDAAREMVRWRLGALPVVDGDHRVIGILGVENRANLVEGVTAHSGTAAVTAQDLYRSL